MYETFYGLMEKPFSMTPDSRYFYPSKRHTDALNHMVYAIQERRGFVVITGDIGAGKTTLSRVLFQKLDPTTKTAIIRNTHLTAKELITLTLEELEIGHEPTRSKTHLIGKLNEFLIDQLQANNNVVLLIDEAQNLKTSVLEEVRMLSNLETDRDKLIQIILMGQPELRDILKLKELTQLRQRVTLLYHLAPLGEEECMGYVRHRLMIAGGKQAAGIFDEVALRRVFRHTQGVPRLVNGLCDRALLTGYVNEAKTIGAEIVDEAALELPSLGNGELTTNNSNGHEPVSRRPVPDTGDQTEERVVS